MSGLKLNPVFYWARRDNARRSGGAESLTVLTAFKSPASITSAQLTVSCRDALVPSIASDGKSPLPEEQRLDRNMGTLFGWTEDVIDPQKRWPRRLPVGSGFSRNLAPHLDRSSSH